MNVFQAQYAAHYDLLYQTKNYDAECDLIEEVFKRYADKKVRTLLDLGCGTGNHSLRLSARGYAVTAVDASAPMLDIARSKAEQQSRAIDFVHSPIQDLDLKRRYDAALLMFAVLGYQHNSGVLLETMKTVRQHLLPGGIAFMDFWYGPAVLMMKPQSRLKLIQSPFGTTIREAIPVTDVTRQVCRVNYTLINDAMETIRETHVMRYFFPGEMEVLCATTGFQIMRFGKFPELWEDPDEGTWNAAIVLKAV